ncbi:MAG: CRTAC1 family protein [Bacteroidetes bacterium]|nr:CRTAC1 family protein [Bacteroidota bacterium]
MLPVTKFWNNIFSNNVYLENNNNNFVNRADLAPVLACQHSLGSVCFDYDNDGDLDLAVANLSSFNELFKNMYMETGKLSFEPIIDVLFEDEVDSWLGISTSDYNLDGYLDLLKVSQNNIHLFENKNEGNNWLGINCIGKVSNGSAIGAKVYVYATISGKKVKQYRQILSMSGNHSVTSKHLHFGLADASVVDSVEVKWPSGAKQVLSNIEINQNIIIEECATPTPVVNLQAIYSNEQINLTWDNTVTDEDKYIIEYR